MKLEDQVCSLELAKRLKELNVKQESLFYYKAWENPLALIFKLEDVPTEKWRIYYDNADYSDSADYIISAFTVAELLEFFPGELKDKEQLQIDKWDHDWRINYPLHECWMRDNRLADCAAKMLIYLIENKLIEVKK